MSQEFDSEGYVPRRERHTNQQKRPQKEPSALRGILEFVIYTAIGVAIVLVIRNFFFVPVSVDGASMEPTLEHGERLILNRREDPQRFDVVVFNAPDSEDRQYIKRIIGMPGDSVAVKEGQLYVNDQPVYEPYVEELEANVENWDQYQLDFELEELTGREVVPENHYFVLGDNRINSKDSRAFGFIQDESVHGTTDLLIWPLAEFGEFNEMDEKSIEELNPANY